MSWLSELTGKAGAFLDKMDQAAASSLQEAGISTPSKSVKDTGLQLGGKEPDTSVGRGVGGTPYEPTTTYQSLNSSKERGAAVAQVLVGSASGSAQLTSTPKPPAVISQTKPSMSAGSVGGMMAGKSERRKQTTDDSIFEFLNTPNVGGGGGGNKGGKQRPKQSPSSSRPHSAASQSSSEEKPRPVSTTPVQKQPPVQEGTWTEASYSVPSSRAESRAKDDPDLVEKDEPKETEAVEGEKEMVDGNTGEEKSSSDDQNFPLAAAETVPDSPKTGEKGEVVGEEGGVVREASHEAELEEWKQKVSNLNLENKLLKREVSSLNEEMSTAMSRMEGITSSKDHYESEIHALREQASRLDHMIRQLRSQEEDLQASMVARDSQIEVLRTQLSVTDKALNEANEKIAISRREQERLLQDANLSSGAQNQALDSLKSQLSQTLAQLDKEREAHEAEKLSFIERESLLQSERTQLSDSLASLQRQVAAEQSRTRECQVSAQAAQREVQALRREHEDYKQRATGILQVKEKLINTLQHGEGEGGGGSAAGDARLHELKLEKEHLQEQLTNALGELERLRKEMQDLEERTAADMDGVLEQVRVCEGVLAEEKRLHATTKEEVRRVSQELEIISEDLIKEKTKHRDDEEASKMEVASLKLRMNSLAPGREELESRLRELTENLIQKQTALNTLNSEKSSLNIQLQRLQSELTRAHRPQATDTPHTAVQMNGLESTTAEGLQARTISSVIPSLDQAPTNSRLHNVRRAVNVVDRTSIRLGAFLKRYPQARIFTLIYMLLLHVWVMVVMLTYSPEMHDANDPLHTGM